MFSKTVGTVTFHFEPLLIFGGLILLILFAHLIRSIVTELGFRDITKKLDRNHRPTHLFPLHKYACL